MVRSAATKSKASGGAGGSKNTKKQGKSKTQRPLTEIEVRQEKERKEREKKRFYDLYNKPHSTTAQAQADAAAQAQEAPTSAPAPPPQDGLATNDEEVDVPSVQAASEAAAEGTLELDLDGDEDTVQGGYIPGQSFMDTDSLRSDDDGDERAECFDNEYALMQNGGEADNGFASEMGAMSAGSVFLHIKMSKEEGLFCMNLLGKLRQMDKSGLFLHWIDLGTIEDRLIDEQFTRVEDFVEDVCTCFERAMYYHGHGAQLVQGAANKLKNAFETHYEQRTGRVLRRKGSLKLLPTSVIDDLGVEGVPPQVDLLASDDRAEKSASVPESEDDDNETDYDDEFAHGLAGMEVKVGSLGDYDDDFHPQDAMLSSDDDSLAVEYTDDSDDDDLKLTKELSLYETTQASGAPTDVDAELDERKPAAVATTSAAIGEARVPLANRAGNRADTAPDSLAARQHRKGLGVLLEQQPPAVAGHSVFDGLEAGLFEPQVEAAVTSILRRQEDEGPFVHPLCTVQEIAAWAGIDDRKYIAASTVYNEKAVQQTERVGEFMVEKAGIELPCPFDASGANHHRHLTEEEVRWRVRLLWLLYRDNVLLSTVELGAVFTGTTVVVGGFPVSGAQGGFISRLLDPYDTRIATSLVYEAAFSYAIGQGRAIYIDISRVAAHHAAWKGGDVPEEHKGGMAETAQVVGRCGYDFIVTLGGPSCRSVAAQIDSWGINASVLERPPGTLFATRRFTAPGSSHTTLHVPFLSHPQVMVVQDDCKVKKMLGEAMAWDSVAQMLRGVDGGLNTTGRVLQTLVLTLCGGLGFGMDGGVMVAAFFNADKAMWALRDLEIDSKRALAWEKVPPLAKMWVRQRLGTRTQEEFNDQEWQPQCPKTKEPRSTVICCFLSGMGVEGGLACQDERAKAAARHGVSYEYMAANCFAGGTHDILLSPAEIHEALSANGHEGGNAIAALVKRYIENDHTLTAKEKAAAKESYDGKALGGRVGGTVHKTDGHLATDQSERGKRYELDNTRLKNDADKCRHAEGHAKAGKLMDTGCTFVGSGVAAENDRGYRAAQSFARVTTQPERGVHNRFNPYTRVECAMTTQTATAFRKDRKWPVKG